MFVRYNNIDEDIRPAIRSLHEKAHIHYIRFLMLQRTPADEIERELLRLGLMTSPVHHYGLYFREVIYPSIVKRGLRAYYRNYLRGSEKATLNLETFGNDEDARVAFLKLTAECGVDYFFTHEAKSFYGYASIPTDASGEYIIESGSIPDWEQVLVHPKRFLIEDMLLDGRSPKMIADYFDERFNDDIDPQSIHFFAKTFFNVKRRDLETVIEALDEEFSQIQQSIRDIKNGKKKLTLGERNVAMGELRRRSETIKQQIKRMSGHFSRNAYVQGVLEATDMREMFQDVLQRAQRRMADADERSEVEANDAFAKMTNVMKIASERMLTIDTILANKSTKTVVEEMLEVVQPTMERIEQEQRDALDAAASIFKNAGGAEEDDEENAILGLDD